MNKTPAQTILEGNRLALARLLTMVENDSSESRVALAELFPHTGRAHLVGVTGAPGTGKSSLVNQLALHYRKVENKKIAIIAVDPTSPFTGGAVLGDRVRMRDLSGDTGVFIRSMASRGSLGGIAKTTASFTQVFDAAGFDIVIVETVGAGQSEVDIARLAHTTIVVEAPGLGDDIQAIKAGILEIADVLVINKADRPGVEHTERALRTTLELAHPTRRVFRHHGQMLEVGVSKSEPKSLNFEDADSSVQQNGTHMDNAIWIPPILKTVSTDGKGITEVAGAIAKHAEHLRSSGDWAERERARLRSELEAAIEDALMSRFRSGIQQQVYDGALTQVMERQLSPQEAAKFLLNGRDK